jgi:hypothetical protein
METIPRLILARHQVWDALNLLWSKNSCGLSMVVFQ